jgi:ABC-type branched-subunit amino acid transport system ATPase component
VPLLELRDVSKAFGGLQVIDHLSLHVDQGEIVSVIGPNGAGKTTVFNLITGIFHVDSGEIVFEDNKISGLAPHRLTNRGIARTFQTLRLFLMTSQLAPATGRTRPHKGHFSRRCCSFRAGRSRRTQPGSSPR